MFSYTVSSSKRWKAWNTNPMYCLYSWERCFSFNVCTGCSRKKYSPSEASSSMPMTLRRLDLPEPEGPMMETNSPSLMCRWTSFKIKLGLPPTITHLEIRFRSIILLNCAGCTLSMTCQSANQLLINSLCEHRPQGSSVFDTGTVRKRYTFVCTGRV